MFEKELNTALQCYHSDFPQILLTDNQKNLLSGILSVLVPKIFSKTTINDNKIKIDSDEIKIIDFVYVILPIIRKIDPNYIDNLLSEIKALNNILMISQEKLKKKTPKADKSPKEYLIKQDVVFRRTFFDVVYKSKFKNGNINYSKIANHFGIDPKTARSWMIKYQKYQL